MATLRIEIQLNDTSTGVSTGAILGRLAEYLTSTIPEKNVAEAFGSIVIFREDGVAGERSYEMLVDHDANLSAVGKPTSTTIGPVAQHERDCGVSQPAQPIKARLVITSKISNRYEFASEAEFRAFVMGCIDIRNIVHDFGTARKLQLLRDGDQPVLLYKP